MGTYYVYDYETICNCTVAVFADYHSDDIRVFAIHPYYRDDTHAFIDFLKENRVNGDWHFGYNALAFDSQITEHILANERMLRSMDAEKVTAYIYALAQRTILKSNNREFADYPEFKLTIPVLDIFKMNHWDSHAKRSSLKWIQYTMDWQNMEEMPHPHDEPVMSMDVFNSIISYCINDVLSTKAIFYYQNSYGEQIMKGQINLRSELSDTFKLKLYNASEPRISKEIFLHFLSEKLGKDKREIREMRTPRSRIKVRDIILPYVKFDTPAFKAMHTWFRNLEIEPERDEKGPKYSLKTGGVQTDYGLGGLHGCAPSGIYEQGHDKIILSADVESFYPMLAIKNRWSPAHFPEEMFCDLYESFFHERKKYPKSNPLNYMYKIVLNSTYGLSNDKNSFLYDPLLTFRITVNGQLLLSMLYEQLLTRIPGAEPLMQNTDGLEFRIDEEHRELFYQICDEWQALTKLKLEYVQYTRMIIGDVNNYIAMSTKGDIKCKGRFEFENLALHKNKSYAVITKAIYEYFVNGVKPEDYLKTNRNIFDYCAGVRSQGDWKLEIVNVIERVPAHFYRMSLARKKEYLEENGWERSWVDDNWVPSDAENKEANAGLDTAQAFGVAVLKEAKVEYTRLSKIIRYYISKDGVKIVKSHPDGRSIQLESGRWKQTLFNDYVEKRWEDYHINEQYYLDNIYKEIGNITGTGTKKALLKHTAHLKEGTTQLTLFS